MKTAPITVTEVALIGGFLVLGYVAYRAYAVVSSVSVSGVISDVAKVGAVVVDKAASTVDARKPAQNPNELSLGGVQQAVADAVQRGQDAGATNFFSAYFTGLFK